MDTTPTTAAYEPSAAETASATPRVNWGRIMKGVALVAAVALVGVVSYHLLFAAAAPLVGGISASPTLSGIAEGIGQAATWVGAKLLYAMQFSAGFLNSMLQAALSGLGLSGVAWTGAAATQQAVAIAGAGAATAVAAHVAAPHLHGLADIPSDSTALPADTSTLVAAQTAQAAAHGSTAAHEFAHAAHHAAESAGESHSPQKGWSQQFANKAAFASHSEAVRASQGSKPTLAARADSFSEQLNADRANLDQALAK
ncbi:MAG: hypothetical protein SFW64_02120 [Alphaproteobacteria bacterium]|nr:hypothetical protein [Alphaproteobacteria bacterium]